MNESTEEQWVWSKVHHEPLKIIEINKQWNVTSYKLWSQSQNKSVIHSSHQIDALRNAEYDLEFLIYAIATARINQVYATESIISPLEGNLIPLPHQLTALKKITQNPNQIRFLLADEVGLGKTIEAGLVLKEMKIRDRIKRILILAPRGLVYQWMLEMKDRFNEDFQLIEPSDYDIFEENYWQRFDQVITTVDSVKPLSSRKGWSESKIESYNEKRYNNLLLAGWDLVIVDESHKLGGTSSSVARFRLGKGLAESTPNILLLSATPHQGNRKQFHRLISLLDPKAFPNPNFVSKESVEPYIVRTEKRNAINSEGDLLFTKRTTLLKNIDWQKKHERQKDLYDRITDYALNGYNQAKKENRQHLAFLMILMQRLVSSSTRAIKSALEKRLRVLELEKTQTDTELEEDWNEKDGQMQLDEIFEKILNPLDNEKESVEELLSLTRKCESDGPDTKAEYLLELLGQIQSKESSKTKFLIFTEFTSTQKMLQDFLALRGFDSVILNGSMNMQQRAKTQENFSKNSQILISTEAGGEGLNLQFCHVVINYDLPWNPMRIEQRIGRVDRIGQKLPVQAFNLALSETVESRVLQVLETKLDVILSDLGVDKLSDVLDSSDTELDFNKLYIESLDDPGEIESKVDVFLSSIKNKISREQNYREIITPEENLDVQIAKTVNEHPLPIWIESMVSNYLKLNHGTLREKKHGFDIVWPEGETSLSISFDKKESENENLKFLSLEDIHVREISKYISTFVKGQKIPILELASLPKDISGIWSLWRVGISGNNKTNIIFPMFIHDDGRKLKPTASHIWDLVLSKNTLIQLEHTFDKDPAEVFDENYALSSSEGKIMFEKIQEDYKKNLKNEQEKMRVFFEYQEGLIAKIGLENVRKKRQNDLKNEKRRFVTEMSKLDEIFPEFNAIIMLKIEGTS
jgi:SNF2 family DNA or RNA helicase